VSSPARCGGSPVRCGGGCGDLQAECELDRLETSTLYEKEYRVAGLTE
jgi:hypothetical protein